MATATALRFSNPQVNSSPEAQQFPWEKGVPVNAFWDSIDWVSSIHFLGNFTPDELSKLPIDGNSTASTTDKLKFLLSLLDTKLSEQNAAAALSSFAENQPKAWRNLVFAQHVLQSKLGLVSEAGETIRALVDQFGDNSDDILRQAMADQLIEEGDYAAAEGMMRPIVAKLDVDMTAASPQAIGARRALLKAIWKQGPERRAEATLVVDEVKGSIQEMVGTKYEVYVKDEEEELKKVLGHLAQIL